MLAKTENAEDMTEDQVVDMKAAQEKLMQSAQQLFSKVYEQAGGAGAAGAGPDMGGFDGAAGPDMSGAQDAGFNTDDVVDGDYKEV